MSPSSEDTNARVDVFFESGGAGVAIPVAMLG
jgi:hypothetical protein